MSETPRYYKWFPDKEYDLGTMPFEGDFTKNDRITTYSQDGMQIPYVCNAAGTEFGRIVSTKVNGRIRQVWQPGVTVGPVEISGVSYPVWFAYFGDGVCVAKIPNGELEPVEA